MLQIGDIHIDVVNAGHTMVDTGGPFGLVPRALWSRYYEADDQSRIPLLLNCLLVRADGRTIMVDTGVGSKLSEKARQVQGVVQPEGGLVGALAELGVAAEDVDMVVDTHLHSDHCGGNTYYGENGEVLPTFPNAEYVVQRREYADAAFPDERTRGTYFEDNYVPLYESGQLRLLDDDTEIVPGMRAVVTPGHTRAHMSIVFEQGDDAALYVADLASLWVNFANLAWMTAFDVEPLITLETKRRWQQWVLERDALIIFEHDPVMVAGKLVMPEGERPTVEQVMAATLVGA